VRSRATFKAESRTCRRCGEEFTATRPNMAYCPDHRGTHENTTARGYGAAHRRERARWAPVVAAGDAECAERVCLMVNDRGSRRIDPIDDADWELAHTEDRTGYLGPAHYLCNRKERSLRGKPHPEGHQVTLVCGPPCSGKSTWVEQRARPGDLVVDADVIAVELGSPRTHNHRKPYSEQAEAQVLETLAAIEAGEYDDVDVWVIRSVPSVEHRAELALSIGATEVVVLTEPRDVLVARASQRPNPSATVRIIDWWLSRYTSDEALAPGGESGRAWVL
jgi:5-methylcytosine-specific restriction protein A